MTILIYIIIGFCVGILIGNIELKLYSIDDIESRLSDVEYELKQMKDRKK